MLATTAGLIVASKLERVKPHFVPLRVQVLMYLTPAAQALVPLPALHQGATVDPCMPQFAGPPASVSQVPHGKLQRFNVSVLVSCRCERSNSLFFTPILSLINSPVMVLLCACVSHKWKSTGLE